MRALLSARALRPIVVAVSASLLAACATPGPVERAAVHEAVVPVAVAQAAVAQAAVAQAAVAPPLAPPVVPPVTITGQDIGWPMCPAERGGRDKPMPPDATASFVMPELNSGLAFVQNQCLADHFQWGRDRSSLLGAYLFPNYPDAAMLDAAVSGRYGICATLACRLQNSGYAQAEWDVAQLAATGVALPMIWVDIEHQPRLGGTRMWTPNLSNNRLVLAGAFAYLREHHIRIGLYSYPNGFKEIVGSWALPYPEWIPTGGHLATERLTRCGKPGFSTGPVWMTQSTRLIKAYDIDDDTICPVATNALPVMFASPFTNAPLVANVRDDRLSPYVTRVLRYLSRGAAVSAAQRAMRLPSDGVFGRQTEAAVRRIQVAQGWHGSGVIDVRTWVALGA